jgi:hypothetical protein
MGWTRWGWALALCGALLSGCGGGGGGTPEAGATTPTSAQVLASGFQMDASGVGASGPASGGASTRVINIAITNPAVTQIAVGYAPGVTPPGWLQVTQTGSGSQYQLHLQWNPTGLSAGNYQTSVRLVSADAQDKVLGHQDLAVSLTVDNGSTSATPTPTTTPSTPPATPVVLGAAPRRIDLQVVTGDLSSFATSITVSYQDSRVSTLYAGAPAGSTLPNWLSPSLRRVGSGWALDVAIFRSFFNTSGTYSGTVRVVALSADGEPLGNTDIPVTVKVLNRLSLSSSVSNLSAVSGTLQHLQANVTVLGAGLSWQASAQSDLPVTLKPASGQGDGVLALDVDLSAAAPGGHNVSIQVVSADGQQQGIVLPVAAQTPNLTVSRTSFTFAATNGDAIPAQSSTVGVNNGTDPVVTVSSDAPWLKVLRTDNKASAGFSLQPDPSVGPLASGTYTAKVTVSTLTGGSTLTHSAAVQLKLTAPTLGASVAKLLLGGAQGRDLLAPRLQLALNVPAGIATWKLSASPTWLHPSRSSGGFASNDNSLALSPVLSVLPTGLSSGSLVFDTQVNGDKLKLTVPIEARIDQHKLLPAQVGVAFSQTPGWSRLSQQVKVMDNMGLATPWTALSDQDWLQVTASGRAGEALTLTANTSGMVGNQLRTATVTLASSDPTVVTPEKIRVGLWVGSSTPTTVQVLPRSVTDRFVLDPLMPLMYTTGPNSRDLIVYNLYTGQEVDRVSNALSAAGGSLGALVAPDGSRLYLHNGNNSTVVIDLLSRTVSSIWPLTLQPGLSLMGRPNGKAMILASGNAYDAATGALLGTGLPTNLKLAFDADLRTAYGVNLDATPSTVTKMVLDHSLAGPSPMSLNTLTWVSYGGTGEDIAVSPDGQYMATALATPYAFTRWDTGTLRPLDELPGQAWPGNVEFGPDGRLFAGSSSTSNGIDLWVYRPDGSLQASFMLGSGMSSNQMDNGALKVSGDGFLAVVTTTAGALKIVPVKP